MGRSAKVGGKNIDRARKLVEARPYKLEEAAELLRKAHYVKFDETVELVLNMGVDPKQSDQKVRGTVVLPHGLGKSKRVLVIASGEKVREAQEAGADFVGGDDIVQKIVEGWTDYDAVIATPDMMKSAGRLGKVLGPRGLMPNPKWHGHFRRRARSQGSQSRQSRVPSRQDGPDSLAGGKNQFHGAASGRQRIGAARGDPKGQARVCQGQVHQEDYDDVHDGSGHSD